MENENIEIIKKDLKTIKLKIEELEKSLDSSNKKPEKKIPTEKDFMASKGLSFEEKREEIKNEIAKVEKRLELLTERKKRIEELKRGIEEKEANAKTVEERRSAEQERRGVERQRDTIEEEREKKESEIKLMKLQLKDWDRFYFEKPDLKIDLEQNLDLIVLEEERQNLLLELQRIETETAKIRDFLSDVSSQREIINTKFSEITEIEKNAEKEIKDAEAKLEMDLPEDENKKLQAKRKENEEKRRYAEQIRWEVEDELEKIEKIYSELKAEYQMIPSNINNIKEKLDLINKKIDQK